MKTKENTVTLPRKKNAFLVFFAFKDFGASQEIHRYSFEALLVCIFRNQDHDLQICHITHKCIEVKKLK